jgi:hypothetical protein
MSMQLAVVVWLLLAVFVASRIADFAQRIGSPDITAVAFSEGGDDAYYYFTIARNIANGSGVTIDGQHWTTGFQPLWQLVTGLAFTAGSDRAALALVYGVSFVLWMAGLWLFVLFVRRASPTLLTPMTTALVAVLFLCETHLNHSYFNGLDTGLYLTLCLGLLVMFQHHLQSAPAAAGPGRLVAIGLLAGAVMLSRNDGVFLCAALLAATLVKGARPHPFREGLVVVAIGSVLVLPWLIYCQVVWGYPMPQSGVATSISVLGAIPVPDIARSLDASVVPWFVVKTRTVLDTGPIVLLIALTLAAAAAIAYWRWRDREPAVERSSRLVLLALAATSVLTFLYYPLVSAAGQFFERYFVPAKLLVLILLALFAIHALHRMRLSPAVMAAGIFAFTVATVGSNLYWLWRDYGMTYRSYVGEEAYQFVRSPYDKANIRIGAPESGRLGFLAPQRVVNLDGKMRVDALRAMQTGMMGKFIKEADLDYLFLSDFFVGFYDRIAPGWRDSFKKVGDMGFFEIFANTTKTR